MCQLLLKNRRIFRIINTRSVIAWNKTKEINKTLRMVRTHLPAPGTELGIYTFLAQMPSGLAPWTHSVLCGGGRAIRGRRKRTFLLIVLSDGGVYVAELDGSMAKKPDYRDALDLQEENLD